MSKLNLIWKDPVFAGVISGVIGALISNWIISVSTNRSFFSVLKEFGNVKISLWALVVFVVVFALVYMYFKRKNRFNYDTEFLALDRAVLNGIREQMVFQKDIIRWIRGHDFGVGFESEYLIQLGDFKEESMKPESEFMHPKLEKQRKELVKSVAELLSTLESCCYSNRDHLLSVPPEWEYLQPDRYEDAFRAIEIRRNNVCVSYDELVRMGRRILKV